MRPPISAIRPGVIEDVCRRCTHLQFQQQQWQGQFQRLRPSKSTTSRSLRSETRRFFSQSSPPRASSTRNLPSKRAGANHFLSNPFLNTAKSTYNVRGLRTSGTPASPGQATEAPLNAEENLQPDGLLPHRRRQAARRNAAIAQQLAAGSSSGAPAPTDTTDLPPDASSMLAAAAAQHPADSFRR